MGGGLRLFDRRYSSVPVVLAVRENPRPRPRRLPEPAPALRSDHGAPGGAADDRNRERHRLRAAAMSAAEDRIVQFRSDGLGLTPAAYAQLLAEIAETRGIAEDDYSRDGVVAELEARMAALLGKEAAVSMPSGTLANHLALRLLARNGRRVLAP